MIVKELYNTLRKEGLAVPLNDFERDVARAAGRDEIPDGAWEVPAHVEEEIRERYALPAQGGMKYLNDDGDGFGISTPTKAQPQRPQEALSHLITEKRQPFTVRSWDEVRRHTRAQKTDIAILGMGGAGKSAYLFVLGKKLRSQVKLGKWRVGYMSPEFRKFLDTVETRLPKWEKTRVDASEHFTLFTLTRYFLYPPFKKTVEFASFDYSGESWRRAFQPGAEADIDTPREAQVINEIRERTAAAGGFIIVLDAKLAKQSSIEPDKMRLKRREEGIWHSVMNQLMWLDNRGRASGTKIRRPVAITVNKGDVCGADFEIEDELDRLKSEDEQELAATAAALDSEDTQKKLSLKAKKFVANHFKTLSTQVEGRCPHKDYSVMSCWGQDVIPDRNDPEAAFIPEPHQSFGIEKPLLWMVDNICAAQRANMWRKWTRVGLYLLTAAFVVCSIVAGAWFFSSPWGATKLANAGSPSKAEWVLWFSDYNPLLHVIEDFRDEAPVEMYLRAKNEVAEAYFVRHIGFRETGDWTSAERDARDALRVGSDVPNNEANMERYGAALVTCLLGEARQAEETGEVETRLAHLTSAIREARVFNVSPEEAIEELRGTLVERYTQGLLDREADSPHAAFFTGRERLRELEAGPAQEHTFEEACARAFCGSFDELCRAGDCANASYLASHIATSPFGQTLSAERRKAMYEALVRAWEQQGEKARTSGLLLDSEKAFDQGIRAARRYEIDPAAAYRGLTESYMLELRLLLEAQGLPTANERMNTAKAHLAELSAPEDMQNRFLGQWSCVKGQGLLRQQAYTEAIESFRMAGNTLPREAVANDAVPGLIAAAEAVTDMKQFDTRDFLLRSATEFAGPTDVQRIATLRVAGLIAHSEALLRSGDPKRASGYLSTALELQSDHARAQDLLKHAARAGGMVFIPMGGSGFYLDRTEVSNEAYQRFLRSGPDNVIDPVGYARGDYEIYSREPAAPVVFVSWHEAQAYARYMGKRLPTAAEWEAAWGTKTYPWGSAFPASGVNTRESILGRAAPPDTSQCRADVSSQGVCNLAGNVAEWTATSSGAKYVVKGGNWLDGEQFARRDQRMEKEPGAREKLIGFRCALDALP